MADAGPNSRAAQASPPGSAADDDALRRLAAELAALGSETPAARQVKRVAPWVVSLGLHAGMVLMALLITWTVSNLPKKEDAVLIVADFNALNYAPVVGTDSEETIVTGPTVRDNAPAGAENAAAQQLRSLEGDPLANLAGMLDSGRGGGATISGFAPRAGPTVVRFAGASGSNARKIVYVIDASGSMISHLQIVVDELSRSLEALNSKQSFSVVFFQKNQALAVPPANQLLPATDQEKVKALTWIRDNIVPQGRSNPLAAIELALTHAPDVIFMLSENITGSGEFEIDQRDLLARLNELNPVNADSGRRRTQINCIQFLDPDPLDTLRMIAQEHGGANGYKFLSRTELGLGGGQ